MSFSNHYGRYEDRQWIIQFANEYVATFNLKETETIVKVEKSKVNKRYAAIYNLLVKDFNKYIGNFSDAELIGTYKYIHGKNICNDKKLRELEESTTAYDDILDKIKNEDLFDDIPCVVEYVNRKAEKKRNIEKKKRNLVNAVFDDNWGEPNSMEYDFTIEEMLDMPVIGEEIGEPKVSAEADNESHDNCNHGIFCITGKDSE